ncbi:MAG: TRAP transporter large permease [Deltaproteobacteria bacterium]|nr:TRAP transporter large permease [Deltaproteobacteria bacterium]
MDVIILTICLFLGSLLMNLPVCIVLGGFGIAAIQIFDIPPLMIVQRMITGLDMSSLAAVLFFVLGGEIMSSGGITARLSTVLILLLRRIRGGLAYVTVLVNLLMAGVSGSATADAAATGSVMIPMLKRGGYPPSFSSALVAASATMGPLIPPSILFIIIGSMCNVSILDLFLGGALPGILIALALLILSYISCRRGKFGLVTQDLSSNKKSGEMSLRVIIEFVLALVMPVIILGGMRFGLFTPTEAGAVLVFYSFGLSFFVYRELRIRDLPGILVNASLMTANILVIVGVASIIGYVVARTEIIASIAEHVSVAVESKVQFLMVVNVFLLILGCLMEITAIAIVIAPILIPLAASYGIDPVVIGVVMVFNLMIGLITPPVGMNMYITVAIARTPITSFGRAVMPFLIAMVICLVITTYVPGFVLLLPNVFR